MNFLPRIYGQSKIQKSLKRMVSDDTLSHTIIFYGDEGLGKTTAAIDLAAVLTRDNDKYQKETEMWFSEDVSRYQILTTSDKLLWYIRPLGLELKFEQFRIFFEEMNSFDNQVHVCIIDEAQSMMPPVANALLKTLEEPLNNVYFILITHELNSLLPTIISRAELFPFFPLNKEEYIQLINDFHDKFTLPLNLSIEESFRLTEGNPGMTLSFSSNNNSVGFEEALKFWEIFSENKTAFYKLTEKEFKDRVEFIRYLKCLSLIGQDLMVIASTGKTDFIRCVNFKDIEKIIVQKWTYEKVCKAIKILDKSLKACKRYISVKLIWDMILVEFEHIQKGDIGWKV